MELSAEKKRLLERRLAERGLNDPRAVIPRRGRTGDAPLSFAQQRMWLLDQLDPGSPVYNAGFGLDLAGDLDGAALAASLAAMVCRHDVFRTRFPTAAGEPVQVVAPAGSGPPPPLPVLDLRRLAGPLRAAECRRVGEEIRRWPFDLAAGPLLRLVLVRMEERRHRLLLAVHHIISDGWSLGVFLRDLAALYRALTSGGVSPLPDLPIQYADYAEWQRRWLAAEEGERLLAVWRRRLAGAPAVLELPADRQRGGRSGGFRPAARRFRLDAALACRLRELGEASQATLFMTLLAAFAVLLGRCAATEDVVVGSPIANRHRREVEDLIGVFINTLALRVDLAADPSFRVLLGRVREVTLEAYAHQDLPFEVLVEELQPPRDLDRSPVVQVMLALQSPLPARLELPGLTLTPFRDERVTAALDLTLAMEESGDGIDGWLEYDAGLFDASTVERWAEALQRLLAAVAAQPERPLSTCSLLGEAERHRLLVDWNDSGADLPGERIDEVVTRRARRTPDAVAAVDGGHHLTYGALAVRMNGLALRLRALGVGPEVLVGVCLPASVERLAALLAILAAGGAYLPLEPGDPPARRRFVLADARAAFVLDAETWAGMIGAESAEGAALPATAMPPGGLAYVLYTSGSTGEPKGVPVAQGALSNFLGAMARDLGLNGRDVLLAVTPLSFDIAALELFLPLWLGGRVVLADRTTAGDGARLRAELAACGASAMQATPATWRLLLDAGWTGTPGLRALCGGEALPGPLAERLLAGCAEVWNLYGPTETTIWSAVQRLAPPTAGPRPAVEPIGRPIANTRLVVLDARLAPVPAGVPGELYIGGAGLARGYLGRPALTADRFVPDPTSGAAGARLYRTGDRARHRPDGSLDFLGRFDHQVKLRGFRIEPGEVEAALERHPAVRESAVVVREGPGGDRLIAFFTGDPVDGGLIDARELQSWLGEILPRPMVPALLVQLPELPRTASGKTDRAALAARELTPPAGAPSAPARPRTAVEELVAAVWGEVLDIDRADRIGPDDDFFALGGHSLLATRVASRLREALGVEVPVRRMFERPSLAALCDWIEGERRAVALPSAPPLRPSPRQGDLPLSFSQQRLWFLDQLEGRSATYNLAGAWRLDGLLRPQALARALSGVVGRHEALRTRFPTVHGRPVQAVDAAPGVEPRQVDLAGLPEAVQPAELRRWISRLARQPFDLAAGPLLRATLFRLAPRSHALVVVLHHIVADGWSVGVFVRELAALYDEAAGGRTAALPELPVQYADFAQWQRRWLSGEAWEAHLRYWRHHLSGAPALLPLPIDRPRPVVQTFHGRTHRFVLGEDRMRGLADLGRQAGVTLFITLLAAFAALLSRLTGERDLVVGSPVANRGRRELEPLIGFFVNTLALRVDLAGRPDFRTLLARVRGVALDAYAYQDAPFERLVEELQPERSLSHTPLFQVLLVLQNTPEERLELAGLTLTRLDVESATAKFDLSLSLTAEGGALRGEIEYNTGLFHGTTVARLAGCFAALLAAVGEEPGRPVEECPLLSEAERHALLWSWSAGGDGGGDSGAPASRAADAVTQLFARVAAARPEAVALVAADHHLTYRALGERAARLSRRLRALGAGPETAVALRASRSPETVAALLGILAAGAAYVPVEPDHPAARLDFILRDSGARVLVADEEVEGDPDVEPVVAGPESLAYVLYTSGSTGRPKGVQVGHGALLDFLDAIERRTGWNGRERWFAVTSLTFDIAGLELLFPLTRGGQVVLAGREAAADGSRLARELAASGAEVLQATPSTWRLLLAAGWPGDPRLRILCGGEALPPDLAAELLARGSAVWNLYGPTETTIWSAVRRVEPRPAQSGSAPASEPVGRPLPGERFLVLDRHGSFQPVPAGVLGELHIGGCGLARGYLGRPDLTAERFLPDPFGGVPGARLYRTGDLVRHRPDGDLEFAGRIDLQVKLRGFRVEPGEIEAALAEHPDVAASVVEARDAMGEKRLVAWVVPRRRPAVDPELRREQLGQWQRVWEETYSRALPPADPLLHLSGWNDSATGLPIPEEEMRQWVEGTVGRILALRPRRVLEIGCGTGLLLCRIAPGCEIYLATDVSPAALAQVRALQQAAGGLEHVTLSLRGADDFAGIEAGAFDAVVLNSVTQYLPGLDDLLGVLAGAARVVAPGGFVFVGDVRSLPLLAAHHALVQLHQAPDWMPLAELGRRVRQAVEQEEELVLHPTLFETLGERIPGLHPLRLEVKPGRARNELTRFRYDVVLRVGEPPPAARVSWLDGEGADLTVEFLRGRLAAAEGDGLGLRGLPNDRLGSAGEVLARLGDRRGDRRGWATAGELRQALAGLSRRGVDPGDLEELARALGCGLSVGWSATGDGSLDVVFLRPEAASYAVLSAAAAGRTPRELANDPLRGRFHRGLTARLRGFLQTRLPEPMVPASFVVLDELPLAPSGKVDRRALPGPDVAAAPAAAVAPRSESEKVVARVWAEALGVERVGAHDNFFDLGGHSLLVTQVVGRLQELLGVDLSVVDAFRFPTVAALAEHLDGCLTAGAQPARVARSAVRPPRSRRMEPVAVIGMVGRFPGSPDVDSFWDNLCQGRETISSFTAEELLAAGIDRSVLERPGFVAAKGVLTDVDRFDAGFFGVNPREAELLDPQHRLFLEASWHALEYAGYDPSRGGRVGVYAGSNLSTYLLENLMSNRETFIADAHFHTLLCNDKDYLATRVSYKLNLQGPSLNVSTACSTSLVAVQLACQGLTSGQCDMALAGGVAVQLPVAHGYVYQPDGILSPDGHCRVFDAEARGTVFGSGLGIVVLKRLDEALADGDHVYAVIAGAALNNDGSFKVGFTAPGVQGQVEAVSEALAQAGFTPDTVSYIEAHGTGTALGDPIEVTALTQAFRAGTGRRGFCAIGSVKSNVGHLDTAAGITGFIKTVLALEHRQLPPSLHFTRPNPKIDFADSPFYVNTALRPWPSPDGAPRRAGVSAFGIGGTNAHVVLEEAPPPPPAGPSRPWHLLVLSARTATALEKATAGLARHLAAHPDLPPADVAFTLQVGRAALPHRRALVCESLAEAAAALAADAAPDAARDPRRLATRRAEPGERPVAFLFPGQGAQHAGMGRQVYETEPTFRDTLDRCAELLMPALGLDLRDVLYPGWSGGDRPAASLDDTAIAQPALFAVEYALARLWMEWGVQPRAMAGHSVGEYVAACLAGVLPLDAALGLVAERGRLMQAMPPGAMLAVPLAEEEVRSFLAPAGGELALAAVNGPRDSVVSGPAAEIAALAARLAAAGVEARTLHTSHAFHSAMMEPVLAPFAERLRAVPFDAAAPRIPYLSNLTGGWIAPGEAADPGYWARHLRATVRFSRNLEEVLRQPGCIVLEVGPGRTLSNVAARHPARRPGHVLVSSLPHPREKRPDGPHLLSALGQVWLAGGAVDWTGFHRHGRRRRVPLTPYPFEGDRYWIAPRPWSEVRTADRPPAAAPGPAAEPRSGPAGLFYAPAWQSAPLAAPNATHGTNGADGHGQAAALAEIPAPVLVLLDGDGLGERLVARLAAAGRTVVTARQGAAFGREGETGYVLAPGSAADHAALLADLAARDRLPATVIHLWSLTGGAPLSAEEHLEAGFYGLLALAQALGREVGERRILVVADGLEALAAGEVPCPEKAMLLGPVQVVPQENPQIACRAVDVTFPEDDLQAELLVDRLVAELAAAPAGPLAALRGNGRWARTFAPARLDAAGAVDRLRPEGVTLITGGLGGIGLEVARHLARARRAKLVLTGRSALPAREEWETWLAGHPPEDPVSGRIRAVRELEALGAEVMVAAADVADLESMRAFVARACERFGAIHGVVHAAGVPGGGVIQRKTREMAEAVFAPKLRGARVLDALLAGAPLDFFVLCSSVAGALGGFGQVDYCAANIFLDRFAQWRTTATGQLTVSIGWDAWREVGMTVAAAAGWGGARQGAQRPLTPSDHPLFTGWFTEDGREVHVSRLSAHQHWVLDEHRILGRPTLSGTTCIEMVAAAFASQGGEGTLEIRRLAFLAPLVIGEDEEREVHTVLTRGEEGCEFSVRSAVGPAGTWIEHARGEALWAAAAPVAARDLDELRARCGTREVDLSDEMFQFSVITLGPRWRNLRAVRMGAAAGFARFELSPDFAGDGELYRLHPALLDTATSFLCAVVADGRDYLPFFYKRLRSHGPLPTRGYVYSQAVSLRPKAETLSFDVTLLDDQGRVRVEIEEFTLKHWDSDSFPQGGTAPVLPASEESPSFRLELASSGDLGSAKLLPADRSAPGPGEVEIAVRAVGLNFREVLVALGIVPAPPGMGFGLECAGTVAAIGEGVQDFRVGDDVIALGSGLFGRYATTPAGWVARKPESLGFAEAATLPLAFMTAWYGLVEVGRLQRGERVLLHSAAGGVGLAAVQVAQWSGAEIFATAGSEEKRSYLRSLGIEHVMDSRSPGFADEVMARTGGEGVDVVLNSLAGDLLTRGLGTLRRFGRFIEIGVRDIYADSPLGLGVFEKNLSFTALMIRPDLPRFTPVLRELAEHARRGTFRPLPLQVFPLARAGQAFQTMAQARHIGKIVVTVSEAEERVPARLSAMPANGAAGAAGLLARGLSNQEGIDAFCRILGGTLPYVLVTPREPALLSAADPARMQETLAALDGPQGRHSRPELSTPYVAPRNRVEEELAEIWQELLGIAGIGVHDDFLELGANSLIATQIGSKVRERMAVELSLNTFFEKPTIAGLAELVMAQQAAALGGEALAGILAEVGGLPDDEVARLLATADGGAEGGGAEGGAA